MSEELKELEQIDVVDELKKNYEESKKNLEAEKEKLERDLKAYKEILNTQKTIKVVEKVEKIDPLNSSNLEWAKYIVSVIESNPEKYNKQRNKYTLEYLKQGIELYNHDAELFNTYLGKIRGNHDYDL